MKIAEMKEIIEQIRCEINTLTNLYMTDRQERLYKAAADEIGFYIGNLKKSSRKAEIEAVMHSLVSVRADLFYNWNLE